MLLPIAVEDAPAGRLPWASFAVAGLCVFAFLLQAFASEAPIERASAALEHHVTEHPWLSPDGACGRSLFPEAWREHMQRARAAAEEQGTLPDAETLAAQQRTLEGLCSRLEHAQTETGWRRWALVPAKGASQRGWLSHGFLHADFWHLAGNLLFFYVAAPLVEGVMGGVVFALFYLAAIVAAGASQLFFEPDSMVPMIGASGAVSACMGAFAVFFARQRVRMIYWFVILTGSFKIPAWLFVGAYTLYDAWQLVSGEAGNVALAAHVGGAVFGALTAGVLRAAKWDRHLVVPLSDVSNTWRIDPDLKRGREALAAGDAALARESFESVLERAPKTEEALQALVTLCFDAEDRPAGTRHLERLLVRWWASGRTEEARDLLRDHGRALDATALSPTSLRRFSRELEGLDRIAAVMLHEASGSPEALLRAALLREEGGDVEGAATVARAALGKRPEPAHRDDLTALLQRLDARERHDAAMLKASGLVPVTTERARFIGRDGALLLVATESAPRVQLVPTQVVSLAAAIVERYECGAERCERVLLLEVTADLGGRRTTLRFLSTGLGLATLHPPGTPPREALAALLSELLSAGAAAWPDRDALLEGRFPRVSTLETFAQALLGARVA